MEAKIKVKKRWQSLPLLNKKPLLSPVAWLAGPLSSWPGFGSLVSIPSGPPFPEGLSLLFMPAKFGLFHSGKQQSACKEGQLPPGTHCPSLPHTYQGPGSKVTSGKHRIRVKFSKSCTDDRSGGKAGDQWLFSGSSPNNPLKQNKQMNHKV